MPTTTDNVAVLRHNSRDDQDFIDTVPPATTDNVAVLQRNSRDDQDFIDTLPATTRAVVCGFLSARAVLYSQDTPGHGASDTTVQRAVTTDAAWALERFSSMREHPSFSRMLPAVRRRVEAMIDEAGRGLYLLTPRQVATLAGAA